ncbi:MAG TPA: DUF4124 domain-containing protein [Casimicrobiaceae bacterium]
MRSLSLRAVPLLLAGALAVPLAQADVYTWTDPSGRLNVSNIAPPEGVHVSSVVHEDPPRARPKPPPARDVDVQALIERVAELEVQVGRAKQQPALPPVVYRPVPPAPPVQVNVTVMPSPPVNPYPPSYAGYSGYPYPGYPGLPYDQCDPTIFGCPLGYGLPVGVVVLQTTRPRFKHLDRFAQLPAAQHLVTRPAAVPPAMHMRGGR